MDPRVELFVDSGAFTAWTKGAVVDVDAYGTFLRAHASKITVAANLDVIPGRPGKLPSALDIDKAAAQGWENYATLQKKLRGTDVSLLHAYHRGEPVRWLKKLVDECEYFGLGGLAGRGTTTDKKMSFLDEVMPHLTDDAGRPIRKFHGFGVTSAELVRRYPWYSVDSTTWSNMGRYGWLLLGIDGGRHYAVLDETQELKPHIRSCSDAERDAVRRYIGKWGYRLEDVVCDIKLIHELNILYFLDLERELTERAPAWRRAAAPRSFF